MFRRSISTFQVTVTACLLLSLSPLFFIEIPPSADMPQHISQIALARGEVADSAYEGLSIEWLRPNNLAYAVVLAVYTGLGPEAAARGIVGAVLILQILAMGFLARFAADRIQILPFVCLFLFNHVFYWGFLNFLIGWPVFCLWLNLLKTGRKPDVRTWLYLTLVCGLALYAHVLWLMAAVGILLVRLAVTRFRHWLFFLSALLPAGITAGIWFLGVFRFRADSGFQMSPEWIVLPWERLGPTFVVDGFYGGLKSPVEAAYVLIALAWIAAALWSWRREFWNRSEKLPLLAGGLFLALALAFPNRYSNTIFFASRWMPYAMILLLIGTPPPKWSRHRWLIRTIATTLAAVFLAVTTVTWINFERDELSGLQEALDILPAKSSVLGLDYTKQSRYIKGYPFLQTFAYCQAIKGADLNFSFAEHGTALAKYSPPRKTSWTSGLEWYPQHVTPHDLQQFEYILISGDENVHRVAEGDRALSRINDTGRWRLYRRHRVVP